jgi:hypothetical protein
MLRNISLALYVLRGMKGRAAVGGLTDTLDGARSNGLVI